MEACEHTCAGLAISLTVHTAAEKMYYKKLLTKNYRLQCSHYDGQFQCFSQIPCRALARYPRNSPPQPEYKVANIRQLKAIQSNFVRYKATLRISNLDNFGPQSRLHGGGDWVGWTCPPSARDSVYFSFPVILALSKISANNNC